MEIFCSKPNQEIFLRDLIETLDHTSTIGCNQVVFPMMEKSSLIDNKKQQDFIAIILEILSSTQKSINLVIESELPAKDLLRIADKVNNSRFGVVVDVGNVTAQNLNVASEITLLSPILKEIHIKDREKNGGPTHRLGFGQTPFKDIVASLMQINWGGVMILETPIYDNWNEEAKINYMFTCKCMGLNKIIQ
jgi:sugar phosphate isomerase/epimerase